MGIFTRINSSSSHNYLERMGRMASTNTCEVGDDVVTAFKAFRKKNSEAGALLLKVDPATLTVGLDEEIDDIDLEELGDDLPDSSPRYAIYSYKWTRGERTSYPLVMIFYCPSVATPTQSMMYTSSKSTVAHALDVTKVFDLRDSDDLNEDWLLEQLNNMR